MEIFMKLKGFTLAEVLITLSIIGVVAALTMPKINANVQRRELETSFAKIVRDLENVNQIVIGDKNAKSLAAACGIAANSAQTWDNAMAYFRTIRDYYSITPGINPAVNYTGDGLQNLNTSANWAGYFTSKNREYGMRPLGGFGDVTGYIIFMLDINGPDKGPNRIGIDAHEMVVDMSTGEVYGFGSRATTLFSSERKGDLWTTRCPSAPSAITSARSCAGSIMDNGNRILYDMDSLYN